MLPDPRPIHILAIDGGGIRGLSSLLILRDLLQKLQMKANLHTLPLPCEVFDLICGTSTGGLIALMLGRLRMDIRDAITLYIKLSSIIFARKKPFPCIRRLCGRPVYNATILEACIKDVAAKRMGDGDTPLQDPLNETEPLCRTFVVSVLKFSAATPKLFRTYSTTSQPADTCKMWEAARATAAASTWFDPVTIGDPPQEYIDGAFCGANNPSQLALDEVRDIFPNCQIGCFLSLGTGDSDRVALEGNLASIAADCTRLFTACEGVDRAVYKEFKRNTPEGQANPYFRFSVNKGLGSICLDEWNRHDELAAATMNYIEHYDQAEKAERWVELLMPRAKEISGQLEEAGGLV